MDALEHARENADKAWETECDSDVDAVLVNAVYYLTRVVEDQRRQIDELRRDHDDLASQLEHHPALS